MGTLVTVGTDGFRDFVELPDGRTFNLGSVSVLKLVTTLVKSGALARKALDTFLKKKRATIAVDIAAMEELLRPPRSRWAVHENRLIPPVLRPSPLRGASKMTISQDTTKQTEIETKVAYIEGLLATFQPGAVNPGKCNALRKLARELVADTEPKESEEKESRFEEGKPADPTENMSPEDAKKWKEEHDKNKDKFKSANAAPAAPPKAAEPPQAGQPKEANYKLAMVNDALANSLMGKVEATLKVVEASTRTNTKVAKMDLHTISNKLAEVLQTMDLGDEKLQPALIELTGKVAKIHTHFSKS